MKSSLQNALQQVSAAVNRLIAEDSFPSAVFPQCLQDAVRSYPVRGGKRLRPALLLWACEALGGKPEEALCAAAAVEVYHSWTLVHDDIIDEDDFRRGQPSTHAELADFARSHYRRSENLCRKFGRDFAILAGDIQQSWAVDLMMRTADRGCPAQLVMQLTRALLQTVSRGLISGEALDVEVPMREWDAVSRQDILRVIDGKTVCLLKFSVQAGGAIALRDADMDRPELQVLGSYAEGLGIAFQLRDDYLGVFGNAETFGKPLCSDFQECKPTLLFREAMSRLSEAGRRELLDLTALPEYPMETVEKIRRLLLESGAAQQLLGHIECYTELALKSLEHLPDSSGRQLLSDLADYLLKRNV
ncbi:MAG: polyprenyl synthetase family protein [Lentisphaeria bacterium]|nr:polyprenyl synthetase family protein [Lentisphaeria bacterium]